MVWAFNLCVIATKARTARKSSDRRWTFDEMVAELPESNLPVELWDGEIVMSNTRATQPDVVFISNERLDIIKTRLMGAADLVAEVISPTSRRRDRIDKRDLYEQHGVKEYWLVDPEALTVEVLHLSRGEYQLAGRWRPGERAESRLLKGFSVEVSDLFGQD
jgi:Uma2 family endonuclease